MRIDRAFTAASAFAALAAAALAFIYKLPVAGALGAVSFAGAAAAFVAAALKDKSAKELSGMKGLVAEALRAKETGDLCVAALSACQGALALELAQNERSIAIDAIEDLGPDFDPCDAVKAKTLFEGLDAAIRAMPTLPSLDIDAYKTGLAETRALAPFLDSILEAVPKKTEEATFALIEKYEAVRTISTRASDLANKAAMAAKSEGRESEDGTAVKSREAIRSERVAVQQMAAQSRENAKKLRTVAKEIESGLGLVKGIQEITDRAQLIAFNMAVEAAHIGEQGRGFRVIVNELRSLNERTLDFSKKISTLFDRFGNYTTELVSAMAEQTDTVIVELERGMAAAEAAVESLIGASQATEAFSTDLAKEALQIDSALDGILETLQFQDITRQMVERSRAILKEIDNHVEKASLRLSSGTETAAAPAGGSFEATRQRLLAKVITRAEREAIMEVKR
jgi:hypothetical protein